MGDTEAEVEELIDLGKWYINLRQISKDDLRTHDTRGLEPHCRYYVFHDRYILGSFFFGCVLTWARKTRVAL